MFGEIGLHARRVSRAWLTLTPFLKATNVSSFRCDCVLQSPLLVATSHEELFHRIAAECATLDDAVSAEVEGERSTQ